MYNFRLTTNIVYRHLHLQCSVIYFLALLFIKHKYRLQYCFVVCVSVFFPRSQDILETYMFFIHFYKWGRGGGAFVTSCLSKWSLHLKKEMFVKEHILFCKSCTSFTTILRPPHPPPPPPPSNENEGVGCKSEKGSFSVTLRSDQK